LTKAHFFQKIEVLDIRMNEILTIEDQAHFKKWIELNLTSISWEGRYLDEFNSFWQDIFKPDISIEAQFAVFNDILDLIQEGPLISWIKWLREKLLCYLFIYKNQDIKTLSDAAQMPPTEIATIARDFFIERYPHLEELINVKFQIGNRLSENLYLKFQDLKEELQLSDYIRGSAESEIMTGLEITLYSEWGKLKSSFGLPKGEDQLQKVRHQGNTKSPKFRFFSELLLLFLVGALLIFGIKVGNNIYEKYLIDNISLFEPDFLNIGTNLSFKSETSITKDDIEISMDELEALEKIESKQVFEDKNEVNRYEVESDVVLTSVDALPKDFDIADLEQSTYEEVKKGGYRNNRYGHRKAYRVMMTSVDAEKTKEQVNKLLENFEVKQVDNVKPGTEIPGGIYFNLFVPRTTLKDFLSKVSSIEQATILESKTSQGGPAGADKVFIWIKSI